MLDKPERVGYLINMNEVKTMNEKQEAKIQAAKDALKAAQDEYSDLLTRWHRTGSKDGISAAKAKITRAFNKLEKVRGW
jgi:hypothetical protein